MTIYVEDLKFQCIIGILDFERVTPQDIIINLTISYSYKDEFINYAQVVDIVKENMKNSKYLLIEDALDGLQEILLKKFSLIEELEIKLTKPSILADCKVSVSAKYK
ncbi:MAG: dihydroneopterin aldolase [Campylobacterales bacterium]